MLTEEDLRDLPLGPKDHYKVGVGPAGLTVELADHTFHRHGQDMDRGELLALVRAGELRIRDDRGEFRLPAKDSAVQLVCKELGPRFRGRRAPWERAWWFDLNAATRLCTWPEPALGVWRTQAGRYACNECGGTSDWARITTDEAWEIFYTWGGPPARVLGGFAELRAVPPPVALLEEALAGELGLVAQLGRLVGDAECAWGPAQGADRPASREEAAAQVEGLRRLMEFIKTEVLPDLRWKRTLAARRVQLGYRTQTEAARSMGLDKSTWTALINRPARQPQTGGPTPKT